MQKAAVVIGVNRTGDLTPLETAATGATEIANWLAGEGFDIACLTDSGGPVTSAAVMEAVERFVTMPARYHLLVVYFSGHGYWHAFSDRWLLSGAHERPSEAINLRAAMDLAQYSGVPNIVFVSDACRSIPMTRAGMQVEGVAAFPIFNDVEKASKVDSFKATSEARAAYEGQINGAPQSLLTAALRSAFRSPEASMVRELTVDGKSVEVVPNRRLEEYLQRKIDELLARIDHRLRQDIVINVPSSEDVYIARVERPPHSAAIEPAPAAKPAAAPPLPAGPSFGKLAGEDFNFSFLEDGSPSSMRPASPRDDARIAVGAIRSALRTVRGPKPHLSAHQGASMEGRLQRRLPDPRQSHFESATGFVVRGAEVMRVALKDARSGAAECRAVVLATGDRQGASGLVRIDRDDGTPQVPPGWQGSLALLFKDGRSTVLAALQGYIGHVVVKSDGVAEVNYVPSTNSSRWADYESRREELDRLRAMVALATEQETFQLRSEREAQALAQRIRIGKALDPTLGLYAAHAFSQSASDERVVDLLRHMRQDLGADLFDVRLLASRLLGVEPEGTWPTVPPCPMLTQTWALLVGRGAELPITLARAGEHICNSLWTTFEPEAGDALMAWMAKGDDE